jgi:hypothetical protein
MIEDFEPARVPQRTLEQMEQDAHDFLQATPWMKSSLALDRLQVVGQDAIALVQRVRELEQNFQHMCRDGHPPVWWNEEASGEECPACRALDNNKRLEPGWSERVIRSRERERCAKATCARCRDGLPLTANPQFHSGGGLICHSAAIWALPEEP